MQLIIKVLSHSIVLSCVVSSSGNLVFDGLNKSFLVAITIARPRRQWVTAAQRSVGQDKLSNEMLELGYHQHRNDVTVNDC